MTISDERLKQLALLGCFVDDGCRACETESMARELISRREQNAKLVEVLKASMHAIRSYQYGNSATELAEEMADAYEKLLREAGAIL